MERPYIEQDPGTAPEVAGLRHSEDDKPYAHIPTQNEEEDKEAIPIQPDFEAPSFTNATPEEKTIPRKTNGRRKKRHWVLGILVLVVVTVAAVVGGVVGSRYARGNTTSSTSPPPPPAPQQANAGWAYNGTSLAALSFSTTGPNYVVFYQHSNGDIRQTVWNNSNWHHSEYVTSAARPGTPISAFFTQNGTSPGTGTGNDNVEYHLFFVDKNNVTQELRGTPRSSTWTNGTLGQIGIAVADPADLSAVNAGVCQNVPTAWLVYSIGTGAQTSIVRWDGQSDTWTRDGPMSGVKPGTGFAAQSSENAWRYYSVSPSTSQLEELICPDCCSNSGGSWRPDLINGPLITSSSSPGGIAVSTTTSSGTNSNSRMIYYLDDSTGTVRELNNTFPYPHEAYMTNVSSNVPAGNIGTPIYDTAGTGSSAPVPAGLVVGTAIPNSQIAAVAGGGGYSSSGGTGGGSGWKGKHQQHQQQSQQQQQPEQIWVFYQGSPHVVNVQVRDVDAAGRWLEAITIPVGIPGQ